MPTRLELEPSGSEALGDLEATATNHLIIGLLNNMPDAALRATERQFLGVLDAAASGMSVRLLPYALPEVPRANWGREYVTRCYRSIDRLWDSRLDGLIVTGTEPRSPELADEPYWRTLTTLVEWAEEHTGSTVWSCLAAHAAVLHLDGIRRRPLPDKRFGIFECERVKAHPLTAGARSRMLMPHSRWNDVAERSLTDAGYRIVTRSPAGVDAFAKHGKSLFVFFQGHPEYEAQTLLLEYRRDVKRFLTRERETHPSMPHGYFDARLSEVLTALRERALGDRRAELFADYERALDAAHLTNTWRPAAVQLYRNWLLHLCARKAGRRHHRELAA